MGYIDWVKERMEAFYRKPVDAWEWYRDRYDDIKGVINNKRPLPQQTNQNTTTIINEGDTTVSYSPTYIFNRSGPSVTPRLNPNFPNVVPEIPERRLPEENDNQTPYKSPIGQSLTLKEALTAREYGRLLHRPINNKELVVTAKAAEQPFGESIEESILMQAVYAVRLQLWYKAQYLGIFPKLDTISYDEEEFEDADQRNEEVELMRKISIWDCALLFVPEIFKGFQGYQKGIYGMESIHKIAETFAVSSENAYQEVSCWVYPKIKIEEETVKVDREYADKEAYPFQMVSNGMLIRLYESLGLHEFPFMVAKSLTNNVFEDEDGNKVDENGDIINEDEEIEEDILIENFTEFQQWFVQNFDTVMGKFDIEIEVGDSDLVEVGEQGLNLRIPNVAEALGELTVKSITQDAMLGALMQFCARILVETGTTKKSVVESFYKIESIQDYIGMKLLKKKKNVQFTYSPQYEPNEDEPDSISMFLEPSKEEISIDEFDEKQTLEMRMTTIKEMYGIKRAIYTRNFPDSAKEWVSLIKGGYDLIRGDGKTSDDDDRDDFEKYSEDFEDGFGNYGVFNKLNPWGNEKKYRPRVKRLEGDSDE